MGTLVSFQKATDASGWRYGLAYRTRRVATAWWSVERWNGEGWEIVDTATSYADARRVAGTDEDARAKAVT